VRTAKDFAKTKHEGLPEKKEDTKEELSLVDRILAEALMHNLWLQKPGEKNAKKSSKPG
jgi:hypothetical protein